MLSPLSDLPLWVAGGHQTGGGVMFGNGVEEGGEGWNLGWGREGSILGRRMQSG
jgi:hypothetical protein